MNLLITPALPLNGAQRAALSENNVLYEISDERVPVSALAIDFPLEKIEGIVCNFFFLHNELSVLPNLRFIQLTSVGCDRAPVERIRERGIALFNAGASYAAPMAEWAVAKMLEVLKGSRGFYENQKRHVWEKNRAVRELFSSEVALIGYGNLGREIAARVKAFGASVTAADVYAADASGTADRYLHVSQLETALQTADITVLCLPLTEQTYHMVNDRFLSRMKQGALLMNLSRGALVDEAALMRRLRADAGFFFVSDVFETEPLPPDSPLWDAERVIVTPHNAFIGNHNAQRLFRVVRQNIESFNGGSI